MSSTTPKEQLFLTTAIRRGVPRRLRSIRRTHHRAVSISAVAKRSPIESSKESVITMRSLATQLLRRPLSQSSTSWRANSHAMASNTGLAAVFLATAVVVHQQQREHLATAATRTEAPMATASLYQSPSAATLDHHATASVRHHSPPPQRHTASPTTATAAASTSAPQAYPVRTKEFLVLLGSVPIITVRACLFCLTTT